VAPCAGRAARRGQGGQDPAARRRRLLRRPVGPRRPIRRHRVRPRRPTDRPVVAAAQRPDGSGLDDALDMAGAQGAVADYCPNWWPAATRLLIRRVRLDLDRGQVSGDPRARRRRTLHPQQRALPLDELAEADGVFGYSFIVTNLDVSTGAKAAQVEHWYRHRTQIENLFRDTKHGAALRHLPSGHQAVNRAWMWGALLAASMTGWLHY